MQTRLVTLHASAPFEYLLVVRYETWESVFGLSNATGTLCWWTMSKKYSTHNASINNSKWLLSDSGDLCERLTGVIVGFLHNVLI